LSVGIKTDASARVERRTAAVLRRWSERSRNDVGIDESEWPCPATEDIATRVVTGTETRTALEALGSARAELGLSLAETLADLDALATTLGTIRRRRLARAHADRWVARGWAEGFVAALGPAGCIDALTGLNTSDFLSVRVDQVYQHCAALEVAANDAYALVVIDVQAEPAPLVAAGRRVAVADCLRHWFRAGETLAVNGPHGFVALTPRDPHLPSTVAQLRSSLAAHVPAADPRAWIEPLPRHRQDTRALLTDLQASRPPRR